LRDGIVFCQITVNRMFHLTAFHVCLIMYNTE
jgi:hypothetical protein